MTRSLNEGLRQSSQRTPTLLIAERDPRMEVIVDRAEGVQAPGDEDFRRWAVAAVSAAGREASEVELSVRVVDEAEGRELNGRYRGEGHATNVLAFPAEFPEGADVGLIGDLVICAPVVAREATEQGKSEEAHWAHMVVHGTLHLLGHDHAGDAEAMAMEALETRILSGLGYPDPYQSGPTAAETR